MAEKKTAKARARGCLFRLLAITISFCLALLAGECAVRLLDPQVLYPRYVTASDFGIRVNVPNARYWHTSPEMQAEFRINSKGIRSDREFPFEKPAKTIRIVGVGDSFTQGYEVSVEESYLYVLEQMLKAKRFPVEVINLGVSGHSSAEELIMLKEFGFRFDPDVVIVGYFQNDLDDNVRSNLYKLNDQGRLERAAKTYLPAVGLRDKLYSFAVYRWLAGHSHLLCLFREQVATWVKRQEQEQNIDQATKSGGGAKTTSGANYEQLLGARILDQIKVECAKRDIHFVLLDIPDRLLTESNLPVKLLEEIEPDEIVHTLPALKAAGPDAYLYRQRGHFHWTPRGHEIAAKLLATKIEAILRDQQEPE